MLLKNRQIVERIDAVELTGMNQAHEHVPDASAVGSLIEVSILAVENGLFQGTFTEVVV